MASVVVDPPIGTWEDARRIFLAADRDARYRLSVSETEEIGFMPFSATDFMEYPPSAAEMAAAGRRFAAQINTQLDQTSNKDIFIYTHGYNVDFYYATLVS